MMKKVCLLVIMVAVALMGHAQSLRNNLLKGYKPGDQLEKGVYTSDQDTPRFNTWYGAFNAKRWKWKRGLLSVSRFLIKVTMRADRRLIWRAKGS